MMRAASGTQFQCATTEVDFGTTPVADGTFTITDNTVTSNSIIIASVAYLAPTSKDLDEVEMDDLIVRADQATAGSFSMYIKSADGSYLADKFKINYVHS